MAIWIPTMRRHYNGDAEGDLFLGDAYLTPDAAYTALAKMQARVTELRVAIDAFKRAIVDWTNKHPFPHGESGTLYHRIHEYKTNREAMKIIWRKDLGLKPSDREKYPDLFNITEDDLFGIMAFEVREIAVRNE